MNPILAVVGGGNMAQAILHAALKANVLAPDQILLAEPDAEKRDLFESWGVKTVPSAASFADGFADSTQILLAVKPQYLADAACDLAGAADGRVVISILAGSTSERVAQAVGDRARIVRVMPNLPARIGMGITAIATDSGANDVDVELTLKLFASVGEIVRIDESFMDAFTAIAGSGPAYLFYLAQTMAEAGVDMGFDEAISDQLVRATLVGAATLLKQSSDGAQSLRAAVTSKKGTTDAAIRTLDAAGVDDAIRRAIFAARDRGAELAAM